MPILTVRVDAVYMFEGKAITDPNELAKLHPAPLPGDELGVVFLGTFESDAITDPESLAKHHRKPDEGGRTR